MTKETLRLFWQATWRYKGLLLASEAGAILWVLTSEIAAPFIVSQVINRLSHAAAGSLTLADFAPFLWAYVAVRVVNVVVSRVMMQPYIRLEPNVTRDLEDMSYKALQSHSMGFFADNFSGALVAKVSRFTSSYQKIIETATGDFAMLLYRYVFIMAILFYLNVVIALVFLLWTAIFSGSVVYLHRRKLKHSEAAAAAQTLVTARLADIITNTLTIRSFARSDEERRGFEGLTQDRRDLRFQAYRYGDQIRLYKSVVITVLNILVLGLSIYFGLSGKLGIGSIILIQLFLFQLVNQLWNLGRFMDRFEESLADANEMTEIILQPNDVVDPARPEASRIVRGAIELRDVTFSYHDERHDDALLDRLKIVIPAGQKVGLVGPSGGGKTTITKLLLRFMDIQSGEILIDGQNIAHLRQEDLRRSIAYVPQEPLLFHRSIFENIAYGKPKASREEVLAAAKKAHADDFITQLNHGYETIVGERGVKLSGGQRQRVAIARALLKDAPILVLDEATSSLDSVSERYITEAMGVLMRRRTTIVVAHRLSTIRRLDRILVIRDGQVVEDGSHDELLGRDGLYAQLWSHQAGDLLDDPAATTV
ncbi:MAG TPA: ABC transporter ATP-binding protein [Candidatus Saccharimonadia bacterium]|nr:ABC transporter ATP-binding protein [Candidatus Saccharimonadia bacterium]